MVKICLPIQETQEIPGLRNGNPLQRSWLENSRERGDWWAAVRGGKELDITEHTEHKQGEQVDPAQSPELQ